MRSSRNRPCPCRSGKQYKNCCLHKEQANRAAYAGRSSNQQPGLQENRARRKNTEDSFFDDPERMIHMLNNFRKFTLDRKPHIKEYYRIRTMHQEIVDSMVKYYEDGKFEQKIDPNFVLKEDQGFLNKPENGFILLDSKFDLNTPEGAQAFYDMQIYKPAPNMNCITEAFIQNHRYRNPEKIEFLYSMLSSRLGLFTITGTDLTEGYATLKEVFTGDEYTIIDIGLSGNPNNSGIYIYSRIITHNDISFNTGLNMLFMESDGFIESYIEQQKKEYKPLGELVRFTQLYNRFSNYPSKLKVVTNRI